MPLLCFLCLFDSVSLSEVAAVCIRSDSDVRLYFLACGLKYLCGNTGLSPICIEAPNLVSPGNIVREKSSVTDCLEELGMGSDPANG